MSLLVFVMSIVFVPYCAGAAVFAALDGNHLGMAFFLVAMVGFLVSAWHSAPEQGA